MKRHIVSKILIVSILFSLNMGMDIHAIEDTYTYSRDNLTIVSYSEQWSTRKQLSDLVDELYANTTGEELALLSYIYIKPDRLEGVSGLYYGNLKKVNQRVEMQKGCYIELYNGNEMKSVADYARVLSHEYGHHFMAYYLAKVENLLPKNWLDSDYAKIRGLDNYSKVTYIGEQEKNYNHEWDVVEIFAEDYVQLYGSPEAKKTKILKDITIRLSEGVSDYYYDYRLYNILPQENLDIRLVTDSEPSIRYMQEMTGIALKKQPSQQTISEPRLDYIEKIYNEYNQYRFSWEQTEDMYKYTLVIYPLGYNDYPIPIGTKIYTQKLVLDGGSAVDLEKWIGIFQELEGYYGLRLFAEDIFGYIHSSEEVEINISKTKNKPRMFKDIDSDEWAYDYIMFCSMRDIFIGYEDGTFRPEKNISRDEFITTVLRGVKNIEFAPVSSDYWFEAEGYMAQGNAKKLNIQNWTVEELKAPIIREEMAEILRIGLELNNVIEKRALFEDFDESLLTDIEESTYNRSIYLLEKIGIIEGYSDKTFRPKETASRGEVAKLLRYFNVLSEDD